MGGGVGILILLVVALGAAVTVMLLTLNARWKSAGQLWSEARENFVPAVALVLVGVAALSLVVFVISELL